MNTTTIHKIIIPIGIHIGEKTHHHDQDINLHIFNIINNIHMVTTGTETMVLLLFLMEKLIFYTFSINTGTFFPPVPIML